MVKINYSAKEQHSVWPDYYINCTKIQLMEERRILTPNSVDDLWDELLPDFSTGIAVNDYHVTLKLNGHSIDLDISSSPGGNVEGGYESTNIRDILQY